MRENGHCPFSWWVQTELAVCRELMHPRHAALLRDRIKELQNMK